MKKTSIPIILILAALLAFSGCAASPTKLAAQGIYAEEYSSETLAANIKYAAVLGHAQLDILFYGRISKVDKLSNDEWRRGYVCKRFVERVDGSYTQLNGYLNAHYDIALKDADLLAAMPRNGVELAVYQLSEASVERCLMDMFERNADKALFIFNSAASLSEFDSAVYDAVVALQKVNYACEYLTDQMSWVVTSYGDVTELELSLDYSKDAVPLSEIPVATDRMGLMQAVVKCWEEDMFSTATVLLNGLELTGDGLLAVLDVAESNCAMVPCEADKIWYEQYAQQDGRQIVRAWMELPVGEELVELQRELAHDVLRRANGITQKHTETEKLYRAAYREVISAASYDDDMFDATVDETLTNGMRIGRSAYGALVEGRTVCSGYARAYKALCDELGLECYVMIGTQKGDGHAWNLVYIGGEKRYVDCSFADTGGGSKYCLFDEETLNDEDYELNENFHIENW